MPPAADTLQRRLAGLVMEARPVFAESLQLARETQSGGSLEQQLAACRALARSLPTSLPPQQAAQVAGLASSWLPAAPDAGGAEAAAAVQLKAEALRLLASALAASAKPPLPPQECRQLLHLACQLCRQPGQPGSIAAGELACGCMDLLAQLPQWYPHTPKPELAAAVAAAASALQQAAAAAGGSSGGTPPETPATTRLLCKALKALQVLLAEAKKDHGANAASLALQLQRLFTYGWQPRSGGTTPKRAAALPAAPAAAAVAAAASRALQAAAGGGALLAAHNAAEAGGSNSGAGSLPSSPAKYRPPHARGGRVPGSTRGAAKQLAAPTAAAPAAEGLSSGSSALHVLAGESSDSESSDAEGGPCSSSDRSYRASRVRSGALACLQLLAKADPKSLHGSWTALLPMSDAVVHWRGGGGGGGGGASVAHLLLHDPQLRVRHAATATVATLLEGPAQRAFLAVAEAREQERQPVRGFITLSAALGQMLAALHQALLHSIAHEADALVLASTLRALGTLLLGTPYHRLPPALLPLCVRAVLSCLARVTPAAGPAALAPEQLPVASASLACLAAAFSAKAPAAALAEHLLPAGGGSDSAAERGSCRASSSGGTGSSGSSRAGSSSGDWRTGSRRSTETGSRRSTDGGSRTSMAGGSYSAPCQPGQQLVSLLFAYAQCQQPALQLEAVMALRGVAQQHAALLRDSWGALLAVGRSGVALPAGTAGPLPGPQAQSGAGGGAGVAGGSVAEKAAQQSVRLPGDYLEAVGSQSEGAGPSAPAAAGAAAVLFTAAAAAAVPAAAAAAAPAAPLVAASGETRGGGSTAQPAGAASSLAALQAAGAAVALAPEAAAQWQQLAGEVLQAAVSHSSPLLRAAAQAVIGGISPPAYAALVPALQQQLLGWCAAALAGDEASPVRAAAAKAVGAIAAAPAVLTVPDGLDRALSALSAGCGDAVLAVRIPAAASLAALCETLSRSAGLQPAQHATSQQEQPPAGACLPDASMAAARHTTAAMLGCLRLAVVAAGDSDKLRPSGLQALGSLFALQGRLPQATLLVQQQRQQEQLLAAAAQAVRDGLPAGNARVQWAACEAAGQLLACPAPAVRQHQAAVLASLAEALQTCPNFRTRALAAAALRQLCSPAAIPGGSLAALVDLVAGVLFQGKANDWQVAAPVAAATPGSAAAPADGGQQQARPSVAELGSKAQLEASLAAAVLHLLSLLPGCAVAAPAGSEAGAGAAAASCRKAFGSSTHLLGLRRLVRQAQAELPVVPPSAPGQPGLSAHGSWQHGGQPALVVQQQQPADQPGSAHPPGFQLGLFDLSHASPQLAARAAEGLALLVEDE